jgi:dsDNA-specific endonuclease/ATPase MutS2
MDARDDDGTPPDEPVDLPITGELDLHTFHPRDVRDVVDAYLDAAVEKGLDEVRIVHGKGIGNLRRTVHALLSKDPRVVSFRLAEGARGSWGATVVTLKATSPAPPEGPPPEP